MDNNKKENVEIYDGTSTISLTLDDGSTIEFVELAGVEYEDNMYAIVEPVEPMEGVEEGEVIIFKVDELDDEAYNYDSNISDEVADAVFEEYLRALPDDDCDCDCDACDCEDCADRDEEKK